MVARKKMKTTQIEGCLPFDIVVEILQRLSTRSVLRFRCVAKSWSSLILSKHFSRKHLHYLDNFGNFEYRIMVSSDDGRKLEHFSVRSALSKFQVPVFDTSHVDKCPTGSTLVYPILRNGKHLQQPPVNNLIGSCNGLICIAGGSLSENDIVYLWNPSIQKSKKIPSFGSERGYNTIRSYGFGYDGSCDDYKVVAFYFCTDKYEVLVKIFSLETGEVKRIMNHKGYWLVDKADQTRGNDTTFANGKIHWFEEQPGQGKRCIAYLDLATEKYGEIENPNSVQFSWGRDSMMALPGGSLYVYCFSYGFNFNGEFAWLVKPNYGSGETTWTPIIVSLRLYSKLGIGHRNPLFMLENGETVWLREENLILIFNPNDFSVRPTQLNSPAHSLRGISYIESLVLPCDDDE